MSETSEAWVLGGIGAARGFYEEYLAPNKETLAIIAGVALAGMALGYLVNESPQT